MKPPKQTIQEYETFFSNVELEQFFGTKPSLLAPSPVVQIAEDSNEGLTVFQCRLGWHIRASRSIHLLISECVRPEDWGSICGKPDGLTKLFGLCGLSPQDCHTITNARPKTQPQAVTLCWHNLGFACDADTFRPQQPVPTDIIRVSPDHPLWPKDPPPGWKFGHIALSDGKEIAESYACHHPGSFGDALWAIGVGVRPEHWRRGLGKAVASCSTQEVVQRGHIALWNTQADNIASARIAESLGYRRTFCQIRIPLSVLGGI